MAPKELQNLLQIHKKNSLQFSICFVYSMNITYSIRNWNAYIFFYHGVHTVIAWSVGFMQLSYSYISTFTLRSMLSSSEFAESNTLALLMHCTKDSIRAGIKSHHQSTSYSDGKRT